MALEQQLETAPGAVPREQEDFEDVSAGYGVARGTRNTYHIEGMENMSAQEYRDAMDRMIRTNRAERVKAGGAIGNLAFHDYMRNLEGKDNYSGPMNFDVIEGKEVEAEQE